jgi:hypothetical protein
MTEKLKDDVAENSIENKQDESIVEQKVDTKDVDTLFAGEDLSEEFKNSAKAIFEAAILAKVAEQRTALDEEYATKLQEETAKINENLVAKVDEYLEYVVGEWMEENKLAVEKGIRAEIAEDFMLGLKNLFTEHYIDIPEEKVDVLEELSGKVETLEKELDKVVTENANLNGQIGGFKKEQIVSEVSEGLSEVQIAKLKSLAEGIEFVSEQDYKEKLELTKKKYFEEDTQDTSASSVSDETSSLDESYSPVMSRYVQGISRTLKK